MDSWQTLVDVRVLRSTATAWSCEATSSIVCGRLERMSENIGSFTRSTRYFSTQGCDAASTTVFDCAVAFCCGFRNILHNQLYIADWCKTKRGLLCPRLKLRTGIPIIITDHTPQYNIISLILILHPPAFLLSTSSPLHLSPLHTPMPARMPTLRPLTNRAPGTCPLPRPP